MFAWSVGPMWLPATGSITIAFLAMVGSAVLETLLGVLAFGTLLFSTILYRDNRARRAAEAEMKRTMSLLQSTLDSTGEGIVVFDANRRVVLYNRRAAEMWDVPPEFEKDRGRDLVHHAIGLLRDPEAFLARARQVDLTAPGETRELLELRDGRTFERYSIPHRIDGRIDGRVWTFRDITSQRAAKRAAELNEMRYRMLYDRNLAGVYTSKVDGTIIDCNQAFADVLGMRTPHDVIGRTVDELHVSPAEQQEIRDILQQVQTIPSIDVALRRANGSIAQVLESISRIELDDEVVLQGTVVDINDLKRAEEQIRFHAYHDVLTLLPNRQLFRDRLAVAIAQAKRAERSVAVIFIDLDDFQRLNDTLGHTSGDELLITVAERLQAALRKGDTLARPGGDEFTVVIGDVRGVSDAERVARKLLHAIARPVEIGDRDVFLTASMGLAVYPGDGQDEESLMKSADNALFEAKSAGKNSYRLAAPELNRRVTERFAMENALRRSIDREDFVLHYQPIVDARTEAVVAFEALIRWNHPDRGMLLPADFIPIAEDTSLIVPIGEWALRRACADAVAWQQRGFEGVRVSVNVSARQFQAAGLATLVEETLRASQLRPHLLEMEVTESLAAHDPEATTRILNAVRERGVRISIDDIGTGYSSLAYLKHFPVSTVKIDKSFVKTVVTDRSDAAIVTAVIGVAHSLDMDVVAEGVENDAQAEFLRAHGCNLLQGFRYGHPAPLATWVPDHASPDSPGLSPN